MTTEDFEDKLAAICFSVSEIEDQIDLDPDNSMQLLEDLKHLHRQLVSELAKCTSSSS